MRGVVFVLAGLFSLAAVTVFAGPLYDPFVEIVMTNEAVQAVGYDQYPADIRTAVLKWSSLLFIAFLIVWAVVWYLQREQFSAVRR